MLLQDLHSRAKPNTKESTPSLSSLKEDEQREPASPSEGRAGVMPSTPPQAEDIFVSIPVVDISTEKHPVESTEAKIIDKSVIEEDPPVQSMSKDLAEVSTISKQKDESNEDDWLEDESGEASGPGENAAPLGQDEDVSFSDLEEDDDHGIGAETKAISKSTPNQGKEPMGWVQLSKGPQNKDDWLNVDEVDAE